MSYYYYGNEGGGRRGFLSSLPTAVKNIIIINVLVYLVTSIKGNFMYENFALFYPTSPFFHWWQPVTHMFMHGGFWHLFFNMYTLFIFGSVLERVWGTKKFLIGSHIRSIDGICNAVPGFYNDTYVPTDIIESQVVRADLRSNRTSYRHYWRRKRNSSFRSPWRSDLRLPPDHVLEEEQDTLRKLLTNGKKQDIRTHFPSVDEYCGRTSDSVISFHTRQSG